MSVARNSRDLNDLTSLELSPVHICFIVDIKQNDFLQIYTSKTLFHVNYIRTFSVDLLWFIRGSSVKILRKDLSFFSTFQRKFIITKFKFVEYAQLYVVAICNRITFFL